MTVHVQHSHTSHNHRAWCGEEIVHPAMVYENIDQAAYAALGGHPDLCVICIESVCRALRGDKKWLGAK
jgi:hypothetical protein